MAGSFLASSSEYIDITSSVSDVLQGSLSVWFKSGTNGPQNIISNGDTASGNDYTQLSFGGNLTGTYADESLIWICRTGASNRLFFAIRNGTDFYNDDAWHNLILVIDGSDNRCYIDGDKETLSFISGSTSTTNAFITTSNTNARWIGRVTHPSFNNYLDGEIADLRIYDSNKYINDVEAKIIYESKGADGITTGLVARWLMDDQTDGATMTTCIDVSGNGADGTPTNTPTIEASPIRTG